jgi:hypothetical protein
VFSCESSSCTGVSRELLWLRHCDSSETQRKGNFLPLEAVARRRVKTQLTDKANSVM